MKMLNRWKSAFLNLGRFLMAWGSLVAAVPAGFLLSITPIGDLIGKLVKVASYIIEFIVDLVMNIFDAGNIDLSDGAPFLIWFGVGLVIVIDLIADLTPNRKAVYGAMVWPSLPLNMGGTWGNTLNSWSTSLNKWCQEKMGEALGQSAAFTVGATLVIIAVVAARKVLAAGAGAAAAAAPAAASTQAPSVRQPVRTGRRR